VVGIEEPYAVVQLIWPTTEIDLALLEDLRGEDGRRLVRWYSDEFDLRLMPEVNGVGLIPTEGKNLIVVADVDRVLHFRIFDGDGDMVVDTDEKRVTERVGPIADLRNQLSRSWPPHELTRYEVGRVITAVISMVCHTLADEPQVGAATRGAARGPFDRLIGSSLCWPGEVEEDGELYLQSCEGRVSGIDGDDAVIEQTFPVPGVARLPLRRLIDKLGMVHPVYRPGFAYLSWPLDQIHPVAADCRHDSDQPEEVDSAGLDEPACSEVDLDKTWPGRVFTAGELLANGRRRAPGRTAAAHANTRDAPHGGSVGPDPAACDGGESGGASDDTPES
jgi:hypothetical protein